MFNLCGYKVNKISDMEYHEPKRFFFIANPDVSKRLS
jgi:hypothetical protein